jgi:hypothetical protein
VEVVIVVAAPVTQRLKREPCLNEASHSRKKSDSDTPMRCSVSRMLGQVPSPTPIGGTSGDSISVTAGRRARCSAAIRPAVIQPAEPPPTITIRLSMLGLIT